jgi:hypothetical protein
MATETDIPLRVTRLARLEIAARLGGMLAPPHECLTRPAWEMGLYPETPFRETAVARCTVFLVMTAIAALRIILCLYGVQVDEIATVTLGDIVTPKSIYGKIGIYSTTLMAIETERLIVTLGAVFPRLTCQLTMTARPVRIVVGRYAFCLVAIVTLGKLHFGIFLM